MAENPTLIQKTDTETYHENRLHNGLKKPYFEENLDEHFNKKKLKIQQEIILKRKKQEHQNQQNPNKLTTMAY